MFLLKQMRQLEAMLVKHGATDTEKACE